MQSAQLRIGINLGLPPALRSVSRYTRSNEGVARFAPYALTAAPEAPSVFARTPARLAAHALAYGLRKESESTPTLSQPAEWTLFNHFLRYRMLVDSEGFAAALERGEGHRAILDIHSAFRVEHDYFAALLSIGADLGEYAHKTGFNRAFRESVEGAQRTVTHSLVYYLAARSRDITTTDVESLERALTQIREEGLAPSPAILNNDHWRSYTEDTGRLIHFAACRLVHGELTGGGGFGEITRRHFPAAIGIATHHRAAQIVTWEEIERVRRSHLPNQDKPTLMIAGIGAEWDQVVRYAHAGYNLVLVDPDPSLQPYYADHETARQGLERDYGITIRFESLGLTAEHLESTYRGRIDSLELQNINTGLSSLLEGAAIHALLKPGGVLLQFNPGVIDRGLLQKWPYEYTLLFKAEYVPGVLGTLSERLAYPIDDHILMLQKPHELRC